MDFRPLDKTEADTLRAALRTNSEDKGALIMGKDTSFAGVRDDLPTDDEVISAIKSVPTHYAM
jgi:hypothetical protein